jgi:hypothetical protein
LRVIAEPVAKVDTLDIELREFLASRGTGHENGEESVFDVTVDAC